MTRSAVFLDRDGTLNAVEVRGEKGYSPRRLEDFHLLPGALSATQALKDADFLLIVVTNQPDIGNGDIEISLVEAMHARLRAALPIDDIVVCPHAQSAGCDCRKPKAGMLRAAAAKWDIDLTRSYMVGDRVSDVLAGQAAGCYTLFLNRDYGETRGKQFSADTTVLTLGAAAQVILERHKKIGKQ